MNSANLFTCLTIPDGGVLVVMAWEMIAWWWTDFNVVVDVLVM